MSDNLLLLFASGSALLSVFLIFALFRRRSEGGSASGDLQRSLEKLYLDHKSDSEKSAERILELSGQYAECRAKLEAASGALEEAKLHEEQELAKQKEEYERRLGELAAAKETALKDAHSAHETVRQELQRGIEDLKAENAALRGRQESLMEDLRQTGDRCAALSSDNAALQREMRALKELGERQQSEVENRIRSLTEDIVKKRTQELEDAGVKQVGNTVRPLQEEIVKLQRCLGELQRQNSEQKGSLDAQLRGLQDAQISLSDRATELANALRQGGKAQGVWGEVQLELLLSRAGLQEGVDFEREICGTGDDGAKGRVDAVVRLPEDRCILIDAKCSLTAYLNYSTAEERVGSEITDPAARRKKISELQSAALKDLCRSVKGHIDELIKRKYQSFREFNSPDFVLMFVPLDGALHLALSADPTLLEHAFRNRVFPVTPASLMPALRAVAGLWTLARQSEKLRALVRSANSIYEKGQLMAQRIEAVDRNIRSLQDNMDKLKITATEGNGNLVRLLQSFSVSAATASAELFESAGAVAGADAGSDAKAGAGAGSGRGLGGHKCDPGCEARQDPPSSRAAVTDLVTADADAITALAEDAK